MRHSADLALSEILPMIVTDFPQHPAESRSR